MQAPILRQSGLKVKAVTQLTSLYRIVYLSSFVNERKAEKHDELEKLHALSDHDSKIITGL